MMNMFKFLKIWAVVLLTLILVSCGGGGGSPGVSTGSNVNGVSTSTPTPTPTVVLGVYKTTGARVTSIDFGTGYVVRAAVIDASGIAVAGRLVTFNITDSTIATLAAATALTNSAGIAEVKITPASVTSVGAVTVTAFAAFGTASTSITGSVDVAVSALAAAPNLSLGVYKASGVRVTAIDFNDVYVVRATVLDANGVVVAGRKVTFSLPDSTLAAFSASTALTNASGIAEVRITPASVTAIGAVTVSASALFDAATALKGTADLAVSSAGAPTTASGPTVSIAAYSTNGASVNAIDSAGSYVLRASVLNAQGGVIANKKVTFTLSDSTIAALPTPTALTNSGGIAEVSITPANLASRGALTVTASIVVGTSTAVTGSVDLAVVTNGTPAAAKMVVALYNAGGSLVTTINSSGGFVARAVLTDASGVAVPNRLVTFSSSNTAIATLGATTALTNSSGVAQIPVAPASVTALGAVTLTASAVLSNAVTVADSTDFGVTSSGVVVATSPTLTAGVYNASGASVSAIDLSGAYVARATVLDASAAPVAGRKVTFGISDATIATLSGTTALTNNSGVAELPIAPTSVSSRGAVTLSASAVVGTSTVTGSYDLAISNANVTLSAITVGSNSLASGGNTSLSVTALISGSPATGTAVNVTYVASCGKINGSGSSVSVTTNGSGVANATYSAVATDGSLCSGGVTITASAAGASPSSTSITVAAPNANAITFVSATPAQIFVAGSGANEQSVVSFKVFSGGNALAGVPVTFSIAVNPGGVGLNVSGSTTAVSGTTDSNGQASVVVFSGTIPGPLKVRAALVSNPSVFGETQNLTVSSGPPSQRFMSLAVSTFNIEGRTVDGTNTTLSVRLADRQGNPVENGTVVNFTAEGGQVASSCATTQVNGISSCSVTFISQNPRPANGRASVLAFTNGTKDYTDLNGNNRYDVGVDTLLNQGDAYRDDNENGVFDAGEFLIPRGGSSVCAGSGEPFTSRQDTCDTLLSTTVRQQAVILFSSSSPFITPITRDSVEAAATGLPVSPSLSRIDFNIASALNGLRTLLPMPAGTTITAAANQIASGSSCSVVGAGGSPVPSINPTIDPFADLTQDWFVDLKDCKVGDTVSIKITVPSGLVNGFTRPL